jgi:hypothetical protein
MSKGEIIFFMRFKGVLDAEMIAKWLYDNVAKLGVNISFEFKKDLSISSCEISYECFASAPLYKEFSDEYLIKVHVDEFLVGIKTENGIVFSVQKECPYCACEPSKLRYHHNERDLVIQEGF